MQFLKANTAIDVLIGPFVDSTDGATLETALTISQADVKLSKNGQTLAQKSDITAAAADSTTGYYNCELDATDTNTEGCLVLTVSETGALPIRHEYMVLAEAAYDSMFTAKDTGFMDVNVKAVSEDTAAADNAEAFFDGTGYAGTNNVIPTVTTLTGHTVQTGDTYALANGATGFAAIDTVVDAIKADIDDGGRTDLILDAILVDTSTTLDTKLNDIQGATFSSATDSLEAVRDRGDSAWTGSAVTSDSGTAQAGAAGTITLQAGASAVDDTYNGQLIYISSGTGVGQSRAISDYTGSSKVADVITNWGTTPDATSVYSIYPNEITEITAAPTAAAVADAVWDENTSGHTTGGTFGEQLKVDVDAILSDTGELQTDWADGGRLDLIQDIIAADTTTDIPALIATAQSDLDTLTGTDGVTLATTQSLYAPAKAGDNMGTVSSVTGNVDGSVASVTGAVGSVTGHTAQTGDTFALANGATGFAAIDTVVDAVKVQTDKLTFTVANQVDSNVESINATTVLGVGTTGNKWRA